MKLALLSVAALIVCAASSSGSQEPRVKLVDVQCSQSWQINHFKPLDAKHQWWDIILKGYWEEYVPQV